MGRRKKCWHIGEVYHFPRCSKCNHPLSESYLPRLLQKCTSDLCEINVSSSNEYKHEVMLTNDIVFQVKTKADDEPIGRIFSL